MFTLAVCDRAPCFSLHLALHKKEAGHHCSLCSSIFVFNSIQDEEEMEKNSLLFS